MSYVSLGLDLPSMPTLPGQGSFSPCASLASSGQASPEQVKECANDLLSIRSVEDLGNQITYIGAELAAEAIATGAAAGCAATGVGAVISPLCGLAARAAAQKVTKPVVDFLGTQWRVLSCITDCDCLSARSRAAEASGRRVYDTYAPFCTDASCRAYLQQKYVTGLPTGSEKFTIAGVGVKTCHYKSFPSTPGGVTKEILASGDISAVVQAMAKDPPKPILPDPSLFQRSAERTSSFIAMRTKQVATPWSKNCADDTCRADVARAAALLAAKEAKANLDANVFLPGAPTQYPLTPNTAQAQTARAKAAAEFQVLAQKAIAASKKKSTAAAGAQGQAILLQQQRAAALRAGQQGAEILRQQQSGEKTKVAVGVALAAIVLGGAGIYFWNKKKGHRK